MIRFILLLTTTSLLLMACTEEAPPPRVVEVVVDEVLLMPYRPKTGYIGRLQAQDDVAIQARVTGYLASRDFKEGDLVHTGDVLMDGLCPVGSRYLHSPVDSAGFKLTRAVLALRLT